MWTALLPIGRFLSDRALEFGKRMFLETLKLLVHAGEDALMTTCQLPVEKVTVSQLRRGQITFPAMANLVFQGGTLQSVRLGSDSQLCRHLSELPQDHKLRSGIEQLAGRFLSQALEEMESRFPRGHIDDLEIGPRTIFTRGTRSFGIKFQTSLGQLFLLADIPSRLELEHAKGSDLVQGMMSTYLPGDWTGRDSLGGRSEIDSLLVFLRKVEADLYLEIPTEGDHLATRTGLVLEQCTFADQRALRVNLNVEMGAASGLVPGQRLVGYVGLQDRSLEMELTYLGAEQHSVAEGADLPTALFAIPEGVRVSQRRRAFRIDLLSTVPVEIETVDEDSTATVWFGDEELGSGVEGRLVDLSFSGARIIGDHGDFCPAFPEGTRVRCRLFFPEEPQPLQVLGIVRRSSTKLVDRDSYQDELGVEFLVSPEIDRHSLDVIRQYVLKEQRALLSRRVHVTGKV
jgi:c-di-GMP-binding flagellar brake protein YcgR